MRKINITIACPDNDLAEYNLEQSLKSLLGDNIIDYRKFPNVEHLKEDATYNKLVKAKVKAGKELDNYILNKKL